MWGPKAYTVVCHGCGAIRQEVSSFLSSSLSIGAKLDDGRMLCVPAWGCRACVTDPAKPIRHAFDHGMTAEARARFESEIPLWDWDARPIARRAVQA